MNKEKELAVNTAIITIGKICTQFVGFILLPFYTAVLSTSEYGLVDIVITYSTFLLPIVTFSIEQALFRYLIDARNKESEEEEIISTGSLFLATQCIVTSVVLIVLYAIWGNEFIFLFGLVFISNILLTGVLQLSRGLGDNISYTLGSTISAIIQIVCNLLFITILNMRAEGMIFATFYGNLAGLMVIIWKNKLHIKIKLAKFNYVLLKKMLSYSIALIPNQLSWWALNASDKVIVQFFLGVSANGIIALANRFSSIYIQCSNIFNITWTESASLHIMDDDAQEFFTNIIISVYKLFLCMCCGMVVILSLIFFYFFGGDYQEAYGLIPIFMLASFFNVIVSLYGVIYVAHKKTKEISKTAIYAAIINIVSHLLLINLFGIYAAALSTLIGYAWMAIYRYFHSRRLLVIRFNRTLILESSVMILISLVSYYSGILILKISVLGVLVVTSIYINKEILIKGRSLIKEKIRL